MHPILIKLGPLTVHTYGLFVALGFLAAVFWTMHEARRAGLDVNVLPDAAFRILIGAILGARLFYVFLSPDRFLDNPLEILMFWKGGLVFSGGLVGGTLLGVLYGIRKKQPILRWMDCIAPAVALGQSLGRLGCFCAGCCYGKPTTMPWGVTFTNPVCLAPTGVALHPTQLYHAGSVFLIFLVLLAVRSRFSAPGRRTGLFLVLFAAARVVIEQFRADFRGHVGGFLEGVTPTQITALAFFVLGMYLLCRKSSTKAERE
jgi:phosphatidylglycerol:prolipoprotein diacylglycerol transferase